MQMDFNLDENNNLQIYNGDFLIRDCEQQNAKLICLYQPGHLKSDPQLGIGIENMINGQMIPQYRKIISRELSNDGIKLKDIYFDSNGVLQILI